jgi:hypothetical protein
MLEVEVTPNPWTNGTSHFNQTLDLATATVYVTLGATCIAVWVDANTDALRVTAHAPTPFSLVVRATSTRPTHPWAHSARSTVSGSTTNPDLYLDPLPLSAAGVSLERAGPNPYPFKHASGHKRPLRTLDLSGLPATADFEPATVVAYHRNNASEGENMADLFKQQGIESLISTTPDHWTDRQSGFALDADGPAVAGGGSFRRVDSHTLASVTPATSFALRATVLAVQTTSAPEWLADMVALLAADAARPAAASRAAHEAWWSAFWGRSHVAVNGTKWPPPPPPPTPPTPPPPPPPTPPPPARVLPVKGATLWLRATTLSATHHSGDVVSQWAASASYGGQHAFASNHAASAAAAAAVVVSQPVQALAPKFVGDAFGAGVPAVRFDGVASFLANSNLTLAGGDVGSTHFVVFRDAGSTGPCCNGPLFWKGADIGISTVKGGDGMFVTADGPGYDVAGSLNVLNRTVIAVATCVLAFPISQC